MTRLSTSALLNKANLGSGLCPDEIAYLINHSTAAEWLSMQETARSLTLSRSSKQIHFFAPLYFSNVCINNCAYCGFQAGNRFLKRKVLSDDEFVQEARYLWDEGHRTILLIAGEHPVYSGVGQIASYVTALRRAKLDFSIMVEIAPLSVDDYSMLHALGIRQCLLFQETYDEEKYRQMHQGKKENYDWRLGAMERALEAGIEGVGLGILLGVGSWQEDLVSMVSHAYRIKEKYGRFPTTFSFPRLRDANGVLFHERHVVSDEEFQKILILSRLACPEVGLVLTTRETPSFRTKLIEMGIGITHMSAGSSTAPGGYSLGDEASEESQFELCDHRSLGEVLCHVEELNYQPVLGDRVGKI